MKSILPILLLLFTYSCILEEKKPLEKIQFNFPQLVNSKIDTSLRISKHKADHVSEIFPFFIGKYRFSQQNIDLANRAVDTNMLKDYTYSHGLDILADSIDMTGLELLVDYETSVVYKERYSWRDSILYEYYPVYFVNSTNTDKFFLAKDSHVFGIQEASNTEQRSYAKWIPIEGLGRDWCGNGHWGVIIHPQEYLLILMKKYDGNFETDLRVRFKVGENIYVSKAFKGSINENQFKIKGNFHLESALSDSYMFAIENLFFGAFPMMEE
ncbi:MAG: hypothetical protein AAGG68_24220 [Bacteroidota bacterium]